MITTITLSILLPAVVIPTRPVSLPGPKLPIEINQPAQLPGPTIPIEIDRSLRETIAVVPRPRTKEAPSAIDTLRRMVQDDRPLAIKTAFDRAVPPKVEPVLPAKP